MKLREGNPAINGLEAQPYRKADVHQIWVRNDQVTKHFDPAPQEFNDRYNVWKPRAPRWTSKFRMVNTEGHDYPLAGVLTPSRRGRRTLGTKGTRRKAKSLAVVALLNQQTLPPAAFPKNQRILVRDGKLPAFL